MNAHSGIFFSRLKIDVHIVSLDFAYENFHFDLIVGNNIESVASNEEKRSREFDFVIVNCMSISMGRLMYQIKSHAFAFNLMRQSQQINKHQLKDDEEEVK